MHTVKVEFLHSNAFWKWAIAAGLLCSMFFAWELGAFPSVPSPPRPAVTNGEIIFTAVLIALIALNAGLFNWRRKNGTCPIGTRRASGLGGTMGAVALLCPLCLLLPISLFGVSISLAFLGPFIPLLRTIALALLLGSTALLMPRKR